MITKRMRDFAAAKGTVTGTNASERDYVFYFFWHLDNILKKQASTEKSVLPVTTEDFKDHWQRLSSHTWTMKELSIILRQTAQAIDFFKKTHPKTAQNILSYLQSENGMNLWDNAIHKSYQTSKENKHEIVFTLPALIFLNKHGVKPGAKTIQTLEAVFKDENHHLSTPDLFQTIQHVKDLSQAGIGFAATATLELFRSAGLEHRRFSLKERQDIISNFRYFQGRHGSGTFFIPVAKPQPQRQASSPTRVVASQKKRELAPA
jgi:hypothetical protein